MSSGFNHFQIDLKNTTVVEIHVVTKQNKLIRKFKKGNSMEDDKTKPSLIRAS